MNPENHGKISIFTAVSGKSLGSILPWLASILLIMAAVNLGFMVRNDLFTPSTPERQHLEKDHQQGSILSPALAPITRSQAVETINRAALFGGLDTELVPEITDPIETRLDLTLVATFTHRDPNLAMALISESGMLPVRYRIGDLIQGSAELVDVRAGSVILKRNDRHESLSLSVMAQQ